MRAEDGETPVRIHMINTGEMATARIATPGGRVGYCGDARIDGVPVDLSSPIKLAKTKQHTIELIVDRLIVPDPEGAETRESGNSEAGGSGNSGFGDAAALAFP